MLLFTMLKSPLSCGTSYARHMATASSVGGHVRAPLQLYTLDGRYATAFFNVAVRSNSIDPAEKDMQRLHEMLKKDGNIRGVLESPIIERKSKAATVELISSKLSLAPQTVRLLQLMFENRRLALLHDVCVSFSKLLRAHRKEIVVVVTSHCPLDTSSLKAVGDAVAKNAALCPAEMRSALRVVNNVNPSILGGLIVEVGDNTVDLSASTKIAKIQRTLFD